MKQQGQQYESDVLVIGGGLAGLSYILELLANDPQAQVLLVCKMQRQESNSYYAQGGIASVATVGDSFEKHIADTLKAGDGLSIPEVVSDIVKAAPSSIEFLQSHGVEFDCKSGGDIDLGREGGHSDRRVYHAGDGTGAQIMQALWTSLKKHPQVRILDHHTAVNLITQIKPHTPSAGREVVGAYLLDEMSGLIHTHLAKVTVLATGGAGKVYRYTTNPEVATGDGVAMAYRAGARVGNMEFYQFHPTVLYHPEINNFLISEALRGEGAKLRLPDTGERFMQRYAPEQMELATRDVVARAIFSEIERGDYKHVYLDITHHTRSYLKRRFPTIYKTLQDLGIDISKQMIPVVPAAHYQCGGVLSNAHGKTDLARLYAIGETAFTGLHGANRLACNSLLEAVVTGRLAACESHEQLSKGLKIYRKINNWTSPSEINLRRASQISSHWRGLRGEMSSYAGIVRTKDGLEDLQKLIAARSEMIESYYWAHVVTRDLLELRNIVLVAKLIVDAALARQESRGGHYREDYPDVLDVAEEAIARADNFTKNMAVINYN